MTKHRSTLPRIFPGFLIASVIWAQTGGPVITSVAPNSAPVNSAATAVTISGANFANGATVSFTPPGGGAATTITPSQVQASQIAATIPAALLSTAGTAEIAVSSGGTLTNQLPFTITQVATTTALASSLNPSVYGQSVNFTATVTPSTATGSVTVKEGTATLCTGTIFTSGTPAIATATCSVGTLTAGAHSITAVYAGDINDITSTSSVLTQNVTVATPTVAIISSANPSAVGQSVTLIASITPSIATGTITFKDGSSTLGTGNLSSVGTATLVVSPNFSAGTHSLTVSYAGDVNDHAATSTALSQVVDQPTVATTMSLASAVNPSLFGQSTTLTASVSPSAASGNVTFYDSTTVLETRPLAGGQATVTTKLLPFGAHSLKAYFAFGATYQASTSGALSQIVGATPIPSSGFQPAIYYPTTTGAVSVAPEYVVTADFNGDNIVDLAVANFQTQDVSILLGNGDGTFRAGVNYPVGSTMFGLTVGDFNGDGKADLVTGNGNGKVSVLLGNGDGTFQPAVPYSGGGDYVAVGDFNGDGKTDLATISSGGNALSVMLGNGDGTFQTAVNYGTANGAFGLAVGDFNRDGLADVALSNLGSNDVSILLGNGDGTFQGAINYPVGSTPREVTVGDFNGDGKADLAVANNGGNSLSVLLGNGDGTFQPQVAYPVTTTFLWHVVAGDVNGDGKLDLVAGGGFPGTSGDVAVLLGNGDGTFQAAVDYPVNGFASIALGDFNRDGAVDIAATSAGVSVLLGIPGAGLTATTTALASSVNPSLSGQAITLTATVTPSTATGTVTFKDGTTTLGTGTLSSGKATLTTSTLTTGSHSITAVYAGDSGDAGSTSSILTQTVSVVAPAVTSVTPNSVPALSAATAVTIAGSNFVAGNTVSFTPPGGAPTTITPSQIQAAQIAATLPAALLTSAGTASIAVQGGNTTSNQIPFTITAPLPAISGLSPYSATAGGPAFTLTVNGANFVAGATVDWGATALATTFVSATQLTASVTAAQIAATGPVSVTVANPGPVSSIAFPFTVLAPTGQTWQMLTTSGGPPSAREGAGAVFDRATSQMILFAGASAAYVNDTWSLNTTTNQWSQLAPAGTPPAARRGVSTVYDSVNSIMTVFGGQESASCANDVWTLSKANGSSGTPTWAQLNPAGTAPAPRSFGQAVYDPGSDRMIVFGGNNCSLSTLYNDVWVLANANGLGAAPAWTQLAPTGALPPARNGASAVYDAASNELIIFGGSTGAGDLNDIWVLSNANGIGGTPAWTQVMAAGVAIPARGFHSAVYDSASNRMTVFGGFGAGAVGFSDTWVLTNANNSGGAPTWVQLAASGTIPSARAAQTAVLDPGTNRMVVFGGFNSSFVNLNDTWALSNANDVPSISNLAPSSVTAGGPAFTLTVNGQGFAPGAVVQWNGAPLTTTFVNVAQINASVSAALIASVGSVSIAVTNVGGATSAAAAFTIVPTPAVTSVTPNSVYANSPATAVTIAGSNFGNFSSVAFTPPGGTKTLITPSQIQAAQIAATIPAALLTTAGTAEIVIQNGASTVSNQLPFTIVAAGAVPTISGLSPYSATVGGPAFTLRVSGTNFVANSTVQWGGTALTTTLVRSTLVTASVSAAQIAAPGTVNVTVVNPGSLTSAAFSFTILAPTGQTWTQLMPNGGPPTARNQMGAVFDPSTTQMIVFGGYDTNFNPLNDTWSLNTTTNQWSQLAPLGTVPSARGAFATVYDGANSRMTVFGGAVSSGCVNDVWTLSNANGSTGMPTWTQLSPTGAPPPPRWDHQAVYDPGTNRMIVFGGDNSCPPAYSGGAYNDVWVLTNANGLGGTPAWTQLAPTGALPSVRTDSTAVYDAASNTIIVFGGYGTTNLSEVWTLSHANGLGGTPAWTQVIPAGGAIPARDAHSAVYDPASNRMTVFGGGGGGSVKSEEIFSDTWVLTNANNTGGTPTWTQLAPLGAIPPVRLLQAATLDPATNRMIVFGGAGFGGSFNDVWALSDANGVPSISSLSPPSAAAGGPGFTLTVNGQGFASGDVIKWNGTALTTTFVNATQLTAAVSATLVTTAGSASVTVMDSFGATSAPATFTIVPTPAVTSVTPNSVSANIPVSVTITGSNFGNFSSVSFTPPGGTATLITPSQIQAAQIAATIPAALLTTAGSGTIAIQNGSATLSNQLPFTIVPTGAVPTISGLSPYSATAGGSAFTLTVVGTNFVASSTVQWGGTALTTTLVGATQLTASVAVAQIAAPGQVSVTVANPGPVTSAPFTFTVLAPTGQTWTQLMPTGGPPPPRNNTAAVFDSANSQMILFGGAGAGLLLNDTWSLNTTADQWTQLAPAGVIPPARGGVTGVYDSVNSIMTIFGGNQASSGCLNDVWTLSNANGTAGTPTWTQLSPSGTLPALRARSTSGYDPGSNRMIVFGGDNGCAGAGTDYNDVWVLTNANGLGGSPAWTQLAPTGTLPAARTESSAIYDPASNELIVFGGSGDAGLLSELWILSHANGLGGTPAWTQVAPGGAIPAREAHSAVYDPASNRMTVFGGLTMANIAAGVSNDTWVLSNANNTSGTPTWTQLAPTGTIPPARYDQRAFADPTTNRMIVFGGGQANGAFFNDTWALSDANNVTPSISSLLPNSTTAGGSGFTLTVNGQAFASDSVVRWNGTALVTTFVSATQLTAVVSASLIASQGSVSVTVVNTGGVTSAPLTFSVNAPPQPPPPVQSLTITSGAPPNGTVNVAYAGFTFTGSGGSGSNTWAVSGVAGLTVGSTTGILSGTPTTAGAFTLTVLLSNGGATTSQTYSVTIAGAPLAITTSTLPNGSQNQAYSAQLVGSGGSGNYQWAISGIAGLTVNASSGAISGNPSVGGNLTLNVTLNDASNAGATAATKAFTVVITFPALSIKGSSALGGFAAGGAVSASFTASGGSPAYTWSAAGMPASLSLNASTGQITGSAPGNPGNYSFALTVSDTEKPAASASTTVTLSVLGITTSATLPSGTTATPYSLNFTATGGTPPYTFTAAGVPAGLTMAGSGLLSGTPTSTGTTSFTVQVSDAGGIGATGSFSLTIGSGVQPIQVTGAALPDGSATTSYSQTLEAQDGKPSYKWVVLAGTLPAGLTLSSTGTISGTPTAIGTATFTARATDAAGGFASGVFTINVNPAVLQISGTALPNGMAGLPYGAQPINATGGFPPYSFALTQGTLPSPLTFTSGQINSGVPAAAGTSNFTVTVTDSKGSTASGSFSLVIETTHPDLLLSQGAVSFAIVTGAVTLPAAANVTVGSSVAASLGYTVQVNPAAAWLDVTSNGSTPGTVVIGLDAAKAPALGVGIYQTTVTLACLPFSGCSEGHNIAVSLAVTAPAPQLSVGTGLVSFSATGNSTQTLAQPLSLQNSGGGVVTIQSVTAADSWVKFDAATIPPPSVALAAGQTLQVNVYADTTVLAGPGYYQSTITVTSDAGSASVPVTVLIAANGTITLSPAGSQFNTVAGNAPGNASGSFVVNVSGSSTVNWTAAILPRSPAGAWLTLNTASGTSTSASPGAVTFTVNGTSAALTAQAYYATIEVTVTGGGVSDPVQDYQVVLNVAAAGNILAPNPDPSGLIFLSTGAGTLPAQVVAVGSSSGGVSYAAKTDGSSWLSVSPASGTTSSAAAGQSSVSVNTAGLANGVYHGAINYSIAGQVRTVNVTLIVASAAAAPAISGVTGKATSAGCTATQIIPTQTGLVNNFSLPTAWPTPLEITVVDDCGKAVTSGQVVATFSNGDPPLVLPVVGGSAGVYSGTWTPRGTASQVTIAAQATAQGFKPATVQITGQVTRNGAPVLNPGGTLNAFVPVVGSPLSPGMIVQIYGSNLASQVAVGSTIPLVTTLNNTSVIIGGVAAPLYFVSPGQINAQVPFELQSGSQYQVIVNANGALSTPNPIQLAVDAPGIAAFASGGIIAEHSADGSLVTEGSPAVPGEYIVFFVSGMGLTDNPVVSGQPSPGSPLARPTDPPTLTLNGTNIPIYFAGLTPTLVGLYQVNVQVPANTPNGDLQLVLTQTGGQSNSTVLPVHN